MRGEASLVEEGFDRGKFRGRVEVEAPGLRAASVFPGGHPAFQPPTLRSVSSVFPLRIPAEAVAPPVQFPRPFHGTRAGASMPRSSPTIGWSMTTRAMCNPTVQLPPFILFRPAGPYLGEQSQFSAQNDEMTAILSCAGKVAGRDAETALAPKNQEATAKSSRSCGSRGARPPCGIGVSGRASGLSASDRMIDLIGFSPQDSCRSSSPSGSVLSGLFTGRKRERVCRAPHRQADGP